MSSEEQCEKFNDFLEKAGKVAGEPKTFKGKLKKEAAGRGISGPGLAVTAGLTAGVKLAEFAVDSFVAAMERESQMAELAAVSTENTSLQLERLTELAQNPGLAMEQVIAASTSLQGVGLSAKNAEALIEQMGNALALSGKGGADLDGVTEVLARIGASGKVSAEDINEIGAGLPRIQSLMEEAFGATSAEDLENMGISAEEFFSKITAAGEDLPRAAMSSKELLSNLSDEFNNLKVAAGEALAPLAAELIPLATSAIKGLASVISGLKSMVESLAGAWGAWPVSGELEKQFKLMREQQNLADERQMPKKYKQEFLESDLGATDFLAGKRAEEEKEKGNKKSDPDKSDRPERRVRSAEEQKEESEKAREESMSLWRQRTKVKRQLNQQDHNEAQAGGDVAGMKAALGNFLDTTLGLFHVNKSIAGLEELVRKRSKDGDAEGAQEAMGWLKKAGSMRSDIEAVQEDKKQEREKKEAGLADLRERVDEGAFKMMSPEQQKADMRRQLGESLGIDIKGSADVEKGLKVLRAQADTAREAGDEDGYKAKLEEIETVQGQALKLSGMADTEDMRGGKKRLASGGVANAMAQIFGKASQPAALVDVTRSQITVMQALDKVLTKIKDEGVSLNQDIYTF